MLNGFSIQLLCTLSYHANCLVHSDVLSYNCYQAALYTIIYQAFGGMQSLSLLKPPKP